MVEPTEQQIDALLSSLDEIARDYDHYEYGLPMHGPDEEDSVLNKMRGTVLSWLAERGVEVAAYGVPDGSPAQSQTRNEGGQCAGGKKINPGDALGRCFDCMWAGKLGCPKVPGAREDGLPPIAASVPDGERNEGTK